MEPLGVDTSPLVTKITHISNIVNYYGYMHSGAELFRRLCKKSRHEWNSNLEAISKVIMHNTTNRMTLKFENEFSDKMADILLMNHNYGLYRLSLLLKSPESIDAITRFLNKVEIYPCDLFKSIKLNDTENEFEKVGLFLQKYTEMGFLKESIKMPSYSESGHLILKIIPYNYVCEHLLQFKTFVKYFDILSEDLAYFSQLIEALKSPENVVSIEENLLDQMQGNELIVNELRSIDDLKAIKYSNLSINDEALKSFVSLNHDPDTKIDKGTAIELRILEFEEAAYNKVFSALDKLFTLFPNADELTIYEPVDIAVSIDKVFLQHLKESRYLQFARIKRLKLTWKIEESFTVIKKYNGRIAILVDEKIKFLKAKKLFLEATADEFLHFNDVIAVPDRLNRLEITEGVEIKNTNKEELKEVARIFKTTKNNGSNFTLLVLDTYLHELHCLDFSFLENFIDEEYFHTNRYSYWVNILAISLREGHQILGKHCIKKDDLEDNPDPRSPAQLVSELEDNALLDVGIEYLGEDETVKEKIHTNREEIDHSNGFRIPDADSAIDLFCLLKTKRLRQLQIFPIMEDRTVFNALKSLLSTNNGIQELWLNLIQPQSVSEVFESLQNNYGINDLMLVTPDEVDESIIEQADQFRNKRIGLKICLMTDHERYTNKKDRIGYHYPEYASD